MYIIYWHKILDAHHNACHDLWPNRSSTLFNGSIRRCVAQQLHLFNAVFPFAWNACKRSRHFACMLTLNDNNWISPIPQGLYRIELTFHNLGIVKINSEAWSDLKTSFWFDVKFKRIKDPRVIHFLFIFNSVKFSLMTCAVQRPLRLHRHVLILPVSED